MTTVAEFADLWTSGALARRYPSRVRARIAAKMDAGILRKHIMPVIGATPVGQVSLEDAEGVVDLMPATLASSHRRRVIGLLSRLLDLAVYPAKLLKANPIPRKGFLPLLERSTFTYLRPDEDARLMAFTDCGLTWRIFTGLLTREGLRFSEAMGLTWADLDLAHGIITLRDHKTSRTTGARSWPLDAGSWRTLVWLRGHRGGEGPEARVFGALSVHDGSEHLRRVLWRAGVTRRELHERVPGSRPLRVHDLRGSFVTVARAAGKSDGWIMDRTGHTSGVMLARYARPAREAADRGFGWWTDLDQALPEVAGRAPVPSEIRSFPTKPGAREAEEMNRWRIPGFSTGTPWPHEPDEIAGDSSTFRARVRRVSARRLAKSNLLTVRGAA